MRRIASRVRLMVLAVAVPMLSIGIFLSPATADAPPPPPPVGPSADPQTQIDTVGTTDFPGLDGGYSVAGDTITVYLTSLDSTVEQAFLDQAAGATVQFQSTSNTIATLNSLTDTLQTLWTSIVAGGIQLIQFGPNAVTGKLDIGVANLTPAATQTFANLFGLANINVYNVADPTNGGAHLDVSRTNDIAPYYGGDAIMDAAQARGGCTSGWGIKINGNPRLLTAGHCYDLNTNIVNLKNTATSTTGSGNKMGTVTQRAYGSGLDAEVFTGCNSSGTCGGTGAIWTGSAAGTDTKSVVGVGSWGQGTNVCVSGPYAGTVCNLTVVKANYCDTFEGKQLCHLTKTAGAATPQSGDSGAPVYRPDGTYYVRAVGTHTAHNDVGNEWFTGINTELSQFGATLFVIQ